jgi:hypothetical protein
MAEGPRPFATRKASIAAWNRHAAEGGGDGESRLERIRRLIEEQYIECPTGCGASFEELLCYELHDGGLTFRALAQKWNIGLPTLGSLIADHCKRL